MYRIKLVIEYNGAGFSGWQFQPDERTIQSELLKAIQIVTRQNINHIEASGRTDAGVHAIGQVAHFDCIEKPDLSRIISGVSSILKNEVSIISAEEVEPTFHARFKVKSKIYRYTILNRAAPPTITYGKAWHVAQPLNWDYFDAEAQSLIGTHDFSSFRGGGCLSSTPIKTIHSIKIQRDADEYNIYISGSGFLKNMIRIIIGTLVDRSREKLSLTIKEVLDLKDRKIAGVTAPAHGLCLFKVEY